MIVGFLFGYGGSQYVPSTPAVVPTPATTPINRRLFCLRLLPSRVTTVVRVVAFSSPCHVPSRRFTTVSRVSHPTTVRKKVALSGR